MRKILPFLVVGILVLSGLGAVALNSDAKQTNSNDQGKNAFTHTVFAEDATATWCGYCHYAREALDKIYTSGDYPFFYVCLVDDKNTHAATRINDFNLYGFPTVFFDYGYKTVVGGWTGAEAAYRTAITQCGARTVPNIDVSLNVAWLGDATMDISVGVTNNEAASYAGHLHVYVTEIESSLNWKDTAGHPYTFPFLDYAFNEPITMASGETWENSITWDGHNYNSGMGQDFGSIQYGNIAVIAAVFNNTMHTGYANPPSGNPFNAYWVDDAAGFLVADTGPNTPSNPSPANGATNVGLNADMSWTGGGSPGLTITYDVYFGTASNPPLVVSGQSGTTYDPGVMSYGTTYYWKIVAWDDQGNSAEGPMWHFTTLNNPDEPPSVPEISGPAKGKPGTSYKFDFVSTDPENDNVYYYVDWGDGTYSEWLGPYASGAIASANHMWSTKGTYLIKAKAKDEHGAESDWGVLQFSVPRLKISTNTLFLKLLERFPHTFPVLRQIFGL